MIFVLNLFCIVYLISRLRKSRDQLSSNNSDQKQMYDREIRTLYWFLGVFNVTYLFRGFYNRFYTSQNVDFK